MIDDLRSVISWMAALNRTMLYFSRKIRDRTVQVLQITHARLFAWTMGLRTRVDSRRTSAARTGGNDKSHRRWQQWGHALRKHELQDLAAWLLEAASPLALISAQLLYIGSPFLGSEARHLARLLESDEDRMEFVQILRSNGIDSHERVIGAKT